MPTGSVTSTGIVLAPSMVPGRTVTSRENVRSPATASPAVPLSSSAVVVLPAISPSSASTIRPPIGGVRGATVTVSSTDSPTLTDAGDAAPVAVGGTPIFRVIDVDVEPRLASP